MNIAEQMKDVLKEEIKAAVLKAGLAEESQIPSVLLETPKEKTHGDYSTNMAMQLARIAKKRRDKSLRRSWRHLIKAKLPLKRWILRGPALSTFT